MTRYGKRKQAWTFFCVPASPQVGDLEEYYWFRHNGTQERSMVSNKYITHIISKETKVE